MARRLGRSPLAQETIGFLLAAYLRFVRRTNRVTTAPADLDAAIAGQLPLIAAISGRSSLIYASTSSGTVVNRLVRRTSSK